MFNTTLIYSHIVTAMGVYLDFARETFAAVYERSAPEILDNVEVREPAIESGLEWTGPNVYYEISVTGREGFALLPLRGNEALDSGFNAKQIRTAATSILFGALGADAFDSGIATRRLARAAGAITAQFFNQPAEQSPAVVAQAFFNFTDGNGESHNFPILPGGVISLITNGQPIQTLTIDDNPIESVQRFLNALEISN
ncbi:hypothetical protein VAA96_004537 [Salmonella enterica]|nr:hypothetical protein [Salmonella enterica]